MNTEADSIHDGLPETIDAAAIEAPAPVAEVAVDVPAVEPPSPIVEPVPDELAVTVPPPAAPAVPVKRRRWGRWVVALLLLLLVAVGVWFGLTRRQENEWVMTGQAALADKDWSVAAIAFTQALDTQPAFFRGQIAEASLGRGIAYYHQGEHAAALDDFTLAASRDETLAQPHGYMSLIHYTAGEYEPSLTA